MNFLNYIVVFILLISCSKVDEQSAKANKDPYILVLGVAQDAGYPQLACQKECCKNLYEDQKNRSFVSAIAVVDPEANQSWIFDATPDFTSQMQLLSGHLNDKQLPDGILLTHGHIGHYTGLMYLGREALSAESMPVYAMPRMKKYLTDNGPWSQLIDLKNIEIRPLSRDSITALNERISVTPIPVPHRDEFTETVGFVIQSLSKSALFIPDIDKWNKWDESIVDYIKKVDIALLDATFFKDGEIARDMNEVPHPFVEESMALFEELSVKDKEKIYFIHFNHTNPLLRAGSDAQKEVLKQGYSLAIQGEKIYFN